MKRKNTQNILVPSFFLLYCLGIFYLIGSLDNTFVRSRDQRGAENSRLIRGIQIENTGGEGAGGQWR